MPVKLTPDIEEHLLIERYRAGLHALAYIGPSSFKTCSGPFARNYRIFVTWKSAEQLKWIRFIEKQAPRGLSLAQQIVASVIKQRLNP